MLPLTAATKERVLMNYLLRRLSTKSLLSETLLLKVLKSLQRVLNVPKYDRISFQFENPHSQVICKNQYFVMEHFMKSGHT